MTLESEAREHEANLQCRECGLECDVEPNGLDGNSTELSYVCPEHGVQAVLHPGSHIERDGSA